MFDVLTITQLSDDGTCTYFDQIPARVHLVRIHVGGCIVNISTVMYVEPE